MSRLRQFGRFWYDFVIGDDWRLAVGAAAGARGRRGCWRTPTGRPGGWCRRQSRCCSGSACSGPRPTVRRASHGRARGWNDAGTEAAPRPARAGELAEAVVLADLTLVLSIASQVLPFGGALLVIAVVPMAAVAARNRLRAVVAGTVAASAVGLPRARDAGRHLGGRVRRAGRGRRRLRRATRLRLRAHGRHRRRCSCGRSSRCSSTCLLFVFSAYRKLLLAQVQNAWSGVSHVAEQPARRPAHDARGAGRPVRQRPLTRLVADDSVVVARRGGGRGRRWRSGSRRPRCAGCAPRSPRKPTRWRPTPTRTGERPGHAGTTRGRSRRRCRSRCARSGSAIPAPRPTCCTTSRSRSAPASWSRSSDRTAPGSRRSPASSPGGARAWARSTRPGPAGLGAIRRNRDRVPAARAPGARRARARRRRVGSDATRRRGRRRRVARPGRPAVVRRSRDLDAVGRRAAAARGRGGAGAPAAAADLRRVDRDGRRRGPGPAGLAVALARDRRRHGRRARDAPARPRAQRPIGRSRSSAGRVVPVPPLTAAAPEPRRRVSRRSLDAIRCSSSATSATCTRGARRGSTARSADVNLRIDRGEALLVVGHNGSGKSTLAWMLAGLLEPSEGDARIEGRPLSSVVGQVGVAFQHARLQLLRPTVSAEVSAASGATSLVVWRSLTDVGFDPTRDRTAPRRRAERWGSAPGRARGRARCAGRARSCSTSRSPVSTTAPEPSWVRRSYGCAPSNGSP